MLFKHYPVGSTLLLLWKITSYNIARSAYEKNKKLFMLLNKFLMLNLNLHFIILADYYDTFHLNINRKHPNEKNLNFLYTHIIIFLQVSKN
jgi:hypothetical protein